ncbi:hypothetical protein [Burkholderia cenocepacia]|uniref:hypothetical protein n=1 Tax=Burkholderia cenocepacia TaxID=95486 RepID=UPI00114C8993|nr:hypothetical protein [Burkholderia cenocepacia]
MKLRRGASQKEPVMTVLLASALVLAIVISSHLPGSSGVVRAFATGGLVLLAAFSLSRCVWPYGIEKPAHDDEMSTPTCGKCRATSAVEALRICSASSEAECQGLLLWPPERLARVGRVESSGAFHTEAADKEVPGYPEAKN